MKHIIRRIILSPIIITFALVMSAHATSSQPQGEREFVGTINKNLKIRIKLSRSGDNLSGYYAYERTGGSLRLNGTMMLENAFELEEFDERGNQTGTFKGSFVSEDWIDGIWTSTKTKKKQPFSAFAIGGNQIPATSADDVVSGKYERVDQRGRVDERDEPGELDVWLLKDGRVKVVGNALWVGNAKTGNINSGNVEGIFRLQGSKLLIKDKGGNDCGFTVTFGRNSLTVTDDTGFSSCWGLNVSFNGKYRKVGPPERP